MSDIDDFEFEEEEEEQSSRVNSTPRQFAASAFWEEFKLVTRSYGDYGPLHIEMR
jgi:hypothetical protein